MKFGKNLPRSSLTHCPRFTREISKFQKSEIGKFIPDFPLKHVITSTNVPAARLKYRYRPASLFTDRLQRRCFAVNFLECLF